MAATESILGGPSLTRLVQGIKSGLPLIAPPAFYQPTPGSRIEKNQGKFNRVNGTREVAQLVQYGSASVRSLQQGVEEVPFTALHSFEHIDLPADKLQGLLGVDGAGRDPNGEAEVLRQATYFKQKFMNLRINAVHAALFNFAIYANRAGHMQTGSSGAYTSVDFGVPAGNVGTIGGIIDNWSTATTNIIENIEQVKKLAIQTSGYPLAHAFYGTRVPSLIGSNTEAANYINGDSQMARTMITGAVPPGFAGLQWHPAGNAFWVDQAGTAQYWLAEDEVVFMPDPSPDWWEVFEGSYMIPNSAAPSTSGRLEGLSKIYGMFNYGRVDSFDPPGVRMWGGDTFLPTLKVPGAVFKANTIP